MSVNFTRNLGDQSGVQLNPLVDNSEIAILGAGDQNFAIPMRCLRGRIDKPFAVESSDFYRKLGYGEAMRVNAVNEAWIHVYEAVNNGAQFAIVQRLVSDDAKNNWLSFDLSSLNEPTLADTFNIQIDVAETGGIGGILSIQAKITNGEGEMQWYKNGVPLAGENSDLLLISESVDKDDEGNYTILVTNYETMQESYGTMRVTVTNNVGVFPNNNYILPRARNFTKNRMRERFLEVSLEEQPSKNFEISIKHHECFNDGIHISVHAPETINEFSQRMPSTDIDLRIFDARGNKIYEFSGSLRPDARDDYGNSRYLPDVVELMTDNLEVLINVVGQFYVPVNSACYGYDEFGQEKWIRSELIEYFDEGTVGGYTTENYFNACTKLEKTNYQYKYLASGGNKNVALITQLAELAYRTNKQFRFDVMVGTDNHIFDIDEAIRTYKGMYGEFDATYAHLIHAYWTPLKCNDPTGVNGSIMLGSATLNIALACKRNGVKNAKGFAPKNYPIAGKLFPINRRGVKQVYTPSGTELSQLARAKINPTIFDSFDGQGMYIFQDSLTSAPVINSLRKLIAVIEMSTSVDDAVTSTAKSYLQLPMDIAVKYTKNWLQTYFEGVESANWIVPSDDPQMNGQAFRFEVVPNAQNPYDQMDVKYWLRYDGTNRQTFVTQTLTK